jgi:hypothetical protein
MSLSNRIIKQIKQTQSYYDFDLQDAAREQIPVERLHEICHEAVAENPDLDFNQELLLAMLRWFKAEVTFTGFIQHCPHSLTLIARLLS